MGGGGVGSATTNQATPEAEVKDSGQKDSPLLAALREKMLPDKTITQPITGLLFFEIDGKVKPKQLELFYKTESGDRLGLKFAK